jgi:uncharacterized Zn-binding protein involved in type VI secretion
MPGAARAGDNHTCQLTNPPPANSPHTGGPILPSGCEMTVIINKKPAAVTGAMCTCAGPPDSIVKGSSSVLFGKKPAARQGDKTAHGGSIAVGSTDVIIGG